MTPINHSPIPLAPEKRSASLALYLTAGLGAGCIAGQADAATVVTLFGPGAQDPSSTPPTPAGFTVGSAFYPGYYHAVDSAEIVAAFGDLGSIDGYFTAGPDFESISNWGYASYSYGGSAINGATFGSDQNYANISFNGADGSYEGVAQFYFDGAGGGYLVALARNDDNSPLSISAGKTAIDAVPEPSAMALLALGAGGLIARRRRGAA